MQRVADVVCALIEKQTTNQKKLANGLPGTGSAEAKRKRLARCLQDEQLDACWLPVLISLLPKGKQVLTMDRTNWDHGQTPLNLLVLGVVLEGFTLPLVWVALPHAGCSDSPTRERLIARLLKSLPAKRWKALVADREFIGQDWFTFLRKRGIRRVIRIRADTVVDELRTDIWFETVQTGQLRCLFEKGWVYGSLMQVVATRDADGDLVVLATDVSVWETWQVYGLRWTIECTFSSMKTRGFDLERSAMTIAERLERLFGLVTLAWVCCLRVGVWRNALQPIAVKAHGRRAVSLVSYGWEDLAQAIRWEETMAETYFGLLRHPFPAPGAA
ncbi:IS4 family transposase [Deinococcus radiomollis]|uniref:IS4 family transposase n=1 Tax=Deinococcus radiomollis TaxID=468916 RepID=UPI0038923DFD